MGRLCPEVPLSSTYFKTLHPFYNNNNNNNGLLTVYPPSGSSPVKNYNIKMKNYHILQKKIEIYNIKSNNIRLYKDTNLYKTAVSSPSFEF